MQGLPCKCSLPLGLLVLGWLVCVCVLDRHYYQVYQTQSDDWFKGNGRRNRIEIWKRIGRGKQKQVLWDKIDKCPLKKQPSCGDESSRLMQLNELQQTNDENQGKEEDSCGDGKDSEGELQEDDVDRWRAGRWQMTYDEDDLMENSTRCCSPPTKMWEKARRHCLLQSRVCSIQNIWWPQRMTDASSWSSQSIKQIICEEMDQCNSLWLGLVLKYLGTRREGP